MRYVLMLCLLGAACTQEADVPYPTHQPLPVLNGLLHPDSLVVVTLTESKRLGDQANFPAIDEATVELYDKTDNRSLGPAIYAGQGQYRWDYYPLPGHTYQVEATLPDHPLVSAEDQVPDRPQIISSSYRDTSSSLKPVRLSVANPAGDNIFWLSAYYVNYRRIENDSLPRFPILYDSTQTISEPMSYFAMQQPPLFVDDFNRYYLNYDNTYEFNYYLRMDDELLSAPTFDLEVGFNISRGFDKNNEESGIYATITQASEHYDKYWKSSVIHYLNTDQGDEPDPLSAPVRIYSNVTNGLGMFGAVNSVTVKLEEQL